MLTLMCLSLAGYTICSQTCGENDARTDRHPREPLEFPSRGHPYFTLSPRGLINNGCTLCKFFILVIQLNIGRHDWLRSVFHFSRVSRISIRNKSRGNQSSPSSLIVKNIFSTMNWNRQFSRSTNRKIINCYDSSIERLGEDSEKKFLNRGFIESTSAFDALSNRRKFSQKFLGKRRRKKFERRCERFRSVSSTANSNLWQLTRHSFRNRRYNFLTITFFRNF